MTNFSSKWLFVEHKPLFCGCRKKEPVLACFHVYGIRAGSSANHTPSGSGASNEEMTGMHQQKLSLGRAGYEFAGFSPERWETLRRIAGERCEAARWREEQKARGICPAIKIMEDLIG
jgi:hypothetical protein